MIRDSISYNDQTQSPLVKNQAGHPKKKHIQKRRLFIDSEESPIKCSICGPCGHNKRTCPTHFKGPENNDQDIQKDNIPTHFKVSENNDQNIQKDIIPAKDNTGRMQIPNPESLVICVRLLCNILWSTLSGE